MLQLELFARFLLISLLAAVPEAAWQGWRCTLGSALNDGSSMPPDAEGLDVLDLPTPARLNVSGAAAQV